MKKKFAILFILISIILITSLSESTFDFSSINQIQDINIRGIFLYDTTLDPDGGSWCDDSTKSWYIEAGPFPKIAYLIVSNFGLDIIDANTKSLWLQFFVGTDHLLPNGKYTSLSAGGGKILLGCDYGLLVIDFKADSAKLFTSSGINYINANISDRNSSVIWYKSKSNSISDNSINDVAITRIGDMDYAAVATNRGISIINLLDKTIYKKTDEGIINKISWGGDDLYYGNSDGVYALYDVDSSKDNWHGGEYLFTSTTKPKIIDNNINDIAVIEDSSTSSPGDNTIYIATKSGLTELQENKLQPELAKTTHWAQRNPEATYEILSDNNIKCIATDCASLWLGSDSGLDEIKLVNKSVIYKTYTINSSPSIINNNITSLSGNGLVLVGTQSGFTELDDLWWLERGYKYRQQLLIYNNSPDELPEGHRVTFTFDHNKLVNEGKSLSCGDDIRVVFYDGNRFIELNRLIDEKSNWDTEKTAIFFKTNSAIPPECADNRYYIYYGNPKATVPVNNPQGESGTDQQLLLIHTESEPIVSSNNIEMINIPRGNILSAEQGKDGYINVEFVVDSPYDEKLRVKLEWSNNSAGNFYPCYIRPESISTSYKNSENKPIFNNKSLYQIENIRTDKGPNTIRVDILPADLETFKSFKNNAYWIKLTANNGSYDQEVPDIISLFLDFQKTIETINMHISTAKVSPTAIKEEFILKYKLIFTTPPQTIPVNESSGAITIQLQDKDGNPVNAEKDILIELNTSSGEIYENKN